MGRGEERGERGGMSLQVKEGRDGKVLEELGKGAKG